MNRPRVRFFSFMMFLMVVGLPLAGQEVQRWRQQAVARVVLTDEEKRVFRDDSESLIWFKVERVVEGAQSGFVLRVLSRLPEGARIDGAMHFSGKQIAWCDPVIIENGEGVGTFGPYGERRLLSGEYGFTLHYEPSKQPLALLEKPGIPLEEIVVRSRTRSGSREDEMRERAERRRFYLVYLRKVNLLESEQEENMESVRKGQRFVIGSERSFDPIAWRRWVSDWRERFHRKVFLEMMRARDERVVALRYPAAYSAIQSLYRWNVLLNKAMSREIYHHFGKEIHPEDASGEDVISLSVIRSKIAVSRGLLESVFDR